MGKGCGCMQRAEKIGNALGLPANTVHEFVVDFAATVAALLVLSVIALVLKKGKK